MKDPKATYSRMKTLFFPQNDLYVITWETNFGDLQADHYNETHNQNNEQNTNNNDDTEAVEQPDQILTDVDLRSTGRSTTDEIFPNPISQEDDTQSFNDDTTTSGGSDTIVPEVLESENDDMIVEKESPRGGKYNLRPNPPPTSLKNTDTIQIYLLPVPAYYF